MVIIVQFSDSDSFEKRVDKQLEIGRDFRHCCTYRRTFRHTYIVEIANRERATPRVTISQLHRLPTIRFADAHY